MEAEGSPLIRSPMSALCRDGGIFITSTLNTLSIVANVFSILASRSFIRSCAVRGTCSGVVRTGEDRWEDVWCSVAPWPSFSTCWMKSTSRLCRISRPSCSLLGAVPAFLVRLSGILSSCPPGGWVRVGPETRLVHLHTHLSPHYFN